MMIMIMVMVMMMIMMLLLFLHLFEWWCRGGRGGGLTGRLMIAKWGCRFDLLIDTIVSFSSLIMITTLTCLPLFVVGRRGSCTEPRDGKL